MPDLDCHYLCLLAFSKDVAILIQQNILAEGDICASQRRASSEGLGLLARLGNDMFTARMVSFILIVILPFL